MDFTDWTVFMISYLVNLFVVQTDLKRNGGNGESLKKEKDILCMCVYVSSKKTVVMSSRCL